MRDLPAAVPTCPAAGQPGGIRAGEVPPGEGAGDDPPGVVSGGTLRRVLGSFATGVTVVTVGGARPHGMTANSFTSVSLDPPLVLICVDGQAVMHDRILSVGSFAVSVLCAEQEHVARHFADPRRGAGPAQFEPVSWFPGRHTGAPLISGALAWIECRLWRAYDGGDHSIFLGHLLAAHGRTAQEALVFMRGRYDRLPERRPAPPNQIREVS